MDKYQLIENMLAKLSEISDSTGLTRCTSICELAKMLFLLKEGLNQEDESKRKEIQGLKDYIDKTKSSDIIKE